MARVKSRSLNQDTSFWMIRRKTDGSFSNGKNHFPSFGKTGKMFKSHSLLLRHIAIAKKFQEKHKLQPYLEDCEVVEFSFTEVCSLPAATYGK